MKIIINGQEYPDFEFEKSSLRAALPDVELVESRTLDPDTFIAEARGAGVAMVQYVPITAAVIDALPECRGYIRNGIGYNNLDAAHAARRGIYVANVPDYCIDEVSNHALGMLLVLNRKLMLSHQRVRDGRYAFPAIRPVFRLCDSVLGIVGLGRIGKRVAEKARGLVRRIVFYDPYVDACAHAAKVGLEELFDIADTISLHTPLTDETRGMIGRPLLERMQPHANLINTSRGCIVDEGALFNLLKAGRIAGAGLDVFDEEPLSRTHPCFELENVVLTPHNAWYSEGAMQAVRIAWARQAIQVARGERPTHNVY